MTELLDLHAEFLNPQGCLRLGLRLCLDLLFTCLVVFGVYARKYGKTQYIFTYVMFNVITFTLCFLLRQVPIELGFALGLFAVFGILRYRTEPIRIHDLTYLFVVIGLGILNAVVNAQLSLSEVLLVNVVIVGVVAILEYTPFLQKEKSMHILYDDLAQVQQNDSQALRGALSQRTGRQVTRYTINQVDLLRDTVSITVFYRQESP